MTTEEKYKQAYLALLNELMEAKERLELIEDWLKQSGNLIDFPAYIFEEPA